MIFWKWNDDLHVTNVRRHIFRSSSECVETLLFSSLLSGSYQRLCIFFNSRAMNSFRKLNWRQWPINETLNGECYFQQPNRQTLLTESDTWIVVIRCFHFSLSPNLTTVLLLFPHFSKCKMSIFILFAKQNGKRKEKRTQIFFSHFIWVWCTQVSCRIFGFLHFVTT